MKIDYFLFLAIVFQIPIFNFALNPQISLFDFGDSSPKYEPCPGCKSGELKDMKLHTGIQCQIKDWDLENDGKKKKVIYFHELMK